MATWSWRDKDWLLFCVKILCLKESQGPWVPLPSPLCEVEAAHQGFGRRRRLGDVSVAQVAEPCGQEAHGEEEGT